MKKLSIKLFAFVMALFVSQGMMAQDVLFQESFHDGLGKFVVEGYNGDNNNIWFYDSTEPCLKVEAYGKIPQYDPYESYFVSPEIKLGKDNVISFYEKNNFFTKITDEADICVRLVGETTWTRLNVVQPNETPWILTENVVIPAEFNDKNVQIGFWYSAPNSANYGAWYIKDFVVKGNAGAAPGEKKDPQISYEVGDVVAQLGVEFTAPVLNNPNNVTVVYSAKKPEVATVDPNTGEVTLVGEGFTTITATSVETDEFKSAFANYVLTVKPASESNVLFESSMMKQGEFTREGDLGENDYIWKFANGCAKADAFSAMGNNPIESYIVSPIIKLGSESNFVHFDHMVALFANDVMQEIAFVVRTVGGQWVQVPFNQEPLVNEYSGTGNLNIPAEFNGQEVQFGLKYIAKEKMAAGVWSIRNFVAETKGIAPVQKKTADLSFDVEEVEATLGKPFTAPVVNNPNGLVVSYKSNKESVATVSATGEITLLAEGVAEITATSEANDEFRAGRASYTIRVKAPESKVLFESDMVKQSEFTREGDLGESDYIWKFSSDCAKADAFSAMGDNPVVSYLVSPIIKLGSESNFVHFDHMVAFFTDVMQEIAFVVRTVGGEWVQVPFNQEPLVNEYSATGDLYIPAEFDGQEVQFGFKYTANEKMAAGIWSIRNFVAETKGVAPVQKKTADLSFDVEEVEAILGKPFAAPVVNNPNGLVVSYKSNKESVATVSATGEVTILAEGVAEITATSEANDEFRAGRASYTIRVTVPTGIEGVTADDLKDGKVYNIQGVRVDKLVKGVYIVNGKKVVIK